MRMLNWFDNQFSGRDINPLLNQNDFVVQRRTLYLNPTNKEDAALCPPGPFYYAVYTGLRFNNKIADNAIKLVRQTLARLPVGSIDDLDTQPPTKTEAVKSHVFRLTHALEHLTVADIFLRNAFDPQVIPKEASDLDLGFTFIYSGAWSSGLGFYLRNGFTTPSEEWQSVSNAVRQIKSAN